VVNGQKISGLELLFGKDPKQNRIVLLLNRVLNVFQGCWRRKENFRIRATHDVKVAKEGYNLVKKTRSDYKDRSDQDKEEPYRKSAEENFFISP